MITLSGLNGLFVRILLEVEIRLPFKRVLVVNNDEDSHALLSYEKLFELYFYYGIRWVEGHPCPADEDNDGYFLEDRIFEDEPLVCPSEIAISEEARRKLHDGGMLFFSQPALVDNFVPGEGEIPEVGEQERAQAVKDNEGWTTMVPRRSLNANICKGSARRDERSYDNIVKINKTWGSRANLVSRWRTIVDKGSGVAGVVAGYEQEDKVKGTVDEEDIFMETDCETSVLV
ncbi:hypothetical protein ACFX15_029470 [Malus domestica]